MAVIVHARIAIGYYRNQLREFISGLPRAMPIAATGVSVMFALFALCNPCAMARRGFTAISCRRTGSRNSTRAISGSAELGIGRLLNVAFALPSGYVLLAWCGSITLPLQTLFATLGRRSLGAFVLHVYGVLLSPGAPARRQRSRDEYAGPRPARARDRRDAWCGQLAALGDRPTSAAPRPACCGITSRC